ncbi:hypothetical protein MM239_16740 [Belliella sp. DSM 111904]|uniref:Uncharacterized protein n=1 Tax=Belliella filtrata TaxID=2923435 RepID=A0ABS9V501_9BACT|nr:hypothetical protein [Belliella filtrata]MCH7411055.1 hypothetical protein [Belliella filtrata]
MKKFLLLMVVISTCLVCNKKKENTTFLSEHDHPAVNFNQGLKLLIRGKLYDPDSILDQFIHKKKIVSIVDGVCMKCVINDLNQADLMFREITKENTLAQTIYVLNVPPADSAYFLRHFEPSIDVKGLILWDHGYTFENTNDLLTADRNLRTFLLDENNFIKFFGHPLYNSKLIEKYKSDLIID